MKAKVLLFFFCLLPFIGMAQNLADIRTDIRHTLDEFCSVLNNVNDDVLDYERRFRNIEVYGPQMEPSIFMFNGERPGSIVKWFESYATDSLLYIPVTHTVDITDHTLHKVNANPDDHRYAFEGMMVREFISDQGEAVKDQYPVSFTVVWNRSGKLVEITEINGAWSTLDRKYRNNLSIALELLVKGNYREALDIYHSFAEQGNPKAQCAYAYLNYIGIDGVKKDTHKAGIWMKKAAENNLPEAQLFLGKFHYLGDCGFKKDLSSAVKWFEKAANQDNTESMFILGLMHCDGEGGLPKDSVKALELYQKSADMGFIKSQHELGLWHLDGLGPLSKDEIKAIEWLTLAAEQNYAPSQYMLGHLSYYGSKSRLSDYNEAKIWFLKAIQQNHPEAMYELGYIYQHDKHIYGENINVALDLWEKAGGMGHISSLYMLGLHYWQEYYHEPLLEHLKKSIHYWEQSAGMNDLQSQYMLGLTYIINEKETYNAKKAVEYTTQAAKRNHSGSQLKLGLWYKNGEYGLSKNLKEAFYWLTKSSKQENPNAILELGILYYESKPQNAHKAVELWSKLKYDDYATFYLGVCHFNGEGGLPKDEKKGLDMITEAKGRGVEAADKWLDDYYNKLRSATVKQDEEPSQYTPPVNPAPKPQVSEAERKQADRDYLIGSQYYFGTGGYPKNIKKAIEKWQSAAEMGNAKAQCELATLYLNGESLPKNPELAIVWWTRSAEQGYAKAQYNLGAYYFQNIRKDKQNKQKSKYWLQQAAKQNHAKAIALLNNKIFK